MVAIHTQPKKRIIVGLSGGVDSSVSAYLLKKQGHEVIGIFMKNWEDDDTTSHDTNDAQPQYCSSKEDFIDAAAVADVLGIEIEHVNFSENYKNLVFSEFLHEYNAGRTPNPDVLCNAEIKFKAFLDHAMQLGADHIATGHYARIRQKNYAGKLPTFELLKGLDPQKDQSYFLYRLSQKQLSHALFPIGELLKTQVRDIANDIHLPNAKKKDSTGICFIGERPFRQFLNRYIAHTPGLIKNDEEQTIGEHIGLSFYTIGQRQGLGIGGLKTKNTKGTGNHAPWFVARKDMRTNTLWVVQGHNHPWLQTHSLIAEDVHWIGGSAPAHQSSLNAKTRYRQSDAPCIFTQAYLQGNMQSSDPRFLLNFTHPQWAVTPGQSAVLYDDDICLGGGIIYDNTTPT